MNEPSREVDQLAHDVIGAAIEVHTILGAGFLESTYEEALALEFTLRGIPFKRQWPIALTYKGNRVGDARLDFLVGDLLVVELKAIDSFHPIHQAIALNYLKATNLQLALLINFNVVALREGGIKRVVLTN